MGKLSNPIDVNEKVLLTYHPSTQDINREIDLFILWKIIKNQSIKIFASTFSLSTIAAFIIYSIGPTYKSSIIIIPASNSHIGTIAQELKVMDIDIFNIAINDFLNTFSSESLRRKYYFDTASISKPESSELKRELDFQNFNHNLKIEKNDDFQTLRYKASFLWKNKAESFSTLNNFIKTTKKQVTTNIIAKVNNHLDHEINELKFQKHLELAQRLEEKSIKISKLRSALMIAKNMQIKEIMPSIDGSIKNPLYMRGSKLLTVELDQLQSQKITSFDHTRDLITKRLTNIREKINNANILLITEGNTSIYSVKKVSHQTLWFLASILFAFIISVLITLALDSFQYALNKEKTT